jgi:hypothetical protein
MPAAIDVGLKGHSVRVDCPEGEQRHDLESARIGEDRSWPIHEAMETALARNPVGAGPQHQVVCISQDALASRRSNRIGGHRLDGSRCAHGHKCGCVERAMGCMQDSRPRATVGSQNLEMEMRDPPGRHVHGDWVERGVGA